MNIREKIKLRKIENHTYFDVKRMDFIESYLNKNLDFDKYAFEASAVSAMTTRVRKFQINFFK